MRIYAPNIHLFAFQHYKGLNLDGKSITKQDIKLWCDADDIVTTALKQSLQLTQHILDIEDEPQDLRVELLKPSEVIDGDYSLPFQGYISHDTPLNQNQEILIQGFAYPLRISDCYGLWLNLRRPEQQQDKDIPTPEIDVSLLSKLNPENCLNLAPDTQFIGQTLLITAWLSGQSYYYNQQTYTQKDIYNLAQSCLEAVFPKPEQQPQFYRQGELFGSPIFEYGLFSHLDNYQHVIIWLFQDRDTDDKFNESYHHLLDLFFFRSKIVKSFQDSRKIYQVIAQDYDKIDNIIQSINQIITDSDKSIPDKLNQLNDKLKSLSQESLTYTRLLRNLKDFQNTIDIHSHNYHQRLKQISAATQDNDLTILNNFLEQDTKRFHKQITADIGYFEQGSHLLKQAIASIRGIVEIEQTKLDRTTQQILQQKETADKQRNQHLQTAITILGFGLGAAQIGVSTAPYVFPQQQPPQPIKPPFTTPQIHPSVQVVLFSLLFGLLGAIVGGFLSYFIRFLFSIISTKKQPILTQEKKSENDK